MSDRLAGIVSAVMPTKDFGFITVDGEEREYFFHATAVVGDDFSTFKPGDKVSFTPVASEKGKRAVAVERNGR